MSRYHLPIAAVIVVSGVLGGLPSLAAQTDEGTTDTKARSASEILRDYRAVRMPSFSDGSSPEAAKRFKDAINEGCLRQAELALELYRAWPDHPQVPSTLHTRWAGMNNALGQSKAVLKEVRDVLKKEKRKPIRAEAFAAAARAALLLDAVPRKTKVKLIEGMIKAMPEDERCPVSLLDIAKYHTSDPLEIGKICARILEHWPDSNRAAGPARRLSKHAALVGEPFAFSFKDVASGEQVDTQSFKGKPVLVMLWSHVSERIRKEMAAVEGMGARNQSLRVVGIHNWQLDGGAEALKKRLAELGIDWPHAYPKQEMKTPWSGRWAVGEVPFYYLVDARGNLVGISHRIRMIKERLRELKSPKRGVRKRL
jgi:hypothetical protein